MAGDAINWSKKYICKIYSGVTHIERPEVSGSQNNVFFVDTNDGRFVVKFNYQPLVMKNMVVSRLFEERGIPAPKIHVGNIDGQWYETYPMVQGQTLHQAIGKGMTRSCIKQAYNDILIYFSQMDGIPATALKDQQCRYVHQVAEYNIRNANGGAVAKIFTPLVRMLNAGREKDIGIYHFDITPKNVIVSERGEFQTFIDLDSVALCNRNFALGALAAKYQMLGMSTKYLYDINDALSDRHADRGRINAMLRLNNMGKCLLWHFAQLRGK